MKPLIADIAETWAHRSLLASLVGREVKKRTVGSLLGALWLFLQPLAYLVVLGFVFSVIFRIRRIDPEMEIPYHQFLLSGIVLWLWAQEALSRAATSVIEHESLVKRVRFPVLLLPLAGSLGAALTSLLWIALMGIYLAIWGPTVSIAWLATLPILILYAGLLAGGAMALSAMSVAVRDTLHAIPLGLMILMYATPIFYPAEWVPQRFGLVTTLNPLSVYFESARSALLWGTVPSANAWALMGAFSLASMLLGWAIFRKIRPHMADML